MKYSIYLLGILLLIFSSCDIVNDIKEIGDDLGKYSLDTYTMGPNNPYGTQYEIDYQSKTPERFEIIEFDYEDETYDSNDFYSSRQHVSRVIGLPNEAIEIKKGYVYINDKLLEELYLPDSLRTKDSWAKITLGDEEYYLMIDNREMIYNDSVNDRSHNPYDSRVIGTIQHYEIVGTTNLKKD